MTSTEKFEAIKARALALDRRVLDDPVRREPVRRAGVEIVRDINEMGVDLPVGDPLIQRLIDLGTCVGVDIFRLPAPPTWVPVKMEDA